MKLSLQALLLFLFALPLGLAGPALRESRFLRQRDPCTVVAQGYETIDDTPAINDALRACGNGGTILLPQDQAYSIRSPIDFSPCKKCEVQIEGQLYVSRDYEYWGRSESVFTLSDVHGATIISKTGKGLIDGQAVNYYLSWYGDAYGNRYWKFLTHVTNRSSDITISGLTIKNPIHGFFLTRGNSSNIRFSNLKLVMEQQWGREPYNEAETFGFQIGMASDVVVDGIDIQYTGRAPALANSQIGVCASIDIGAYNVQVRNVACRGAWGGALIQVGSVTPQLIGPGLSNIYFSNWTIDPGVAATGFKDLHYGPGFNFEKRYDKYNGGSISNVTWDGITVKNGPPSVADFCYLRMRNNSPFTAACPANLKVEVRDVVMRNYEVEKKFQMPGAGWGNFNNWSSVAIGCENWRNL